MKVKKTENRILSIPSRIYRAFCYYGAKMIDYRISTYAASASFFLLSSFFPLLMLALSILSFTPVGADDLIELLSDVIPASFQGIFSYVVNDLMQDTGAVSFSLSLIAILWTAAKSMLGLLDGLNSIFDITDHRNYFLKRIVCIGYMLLLLAALLFTLGLRVFGLWIQSALAEYSVYASEMFGHLLQLNWLYIFSIIAVIILIIYTLFPSRHMRFYTQIPGALFTSAAWIIFSLVFSVYVDNFSSFSALYGSLGLIMLFLLWLYFCMYIIFIGAVINRVYPSVFWRVYVALKYKRYRHKVKAMYAKSDPYENNEDESL